MDRSSRWDHQRTLVTDSWCQTAQLKFAAQRGGGDGTCDVDDVKIQLVPRRVRVRLRYLIDITTVDNTLLLLIRTSCANALGVPLARIIIVSYTGWCPMSRRQVSRSHALCQPEASTSTWSSPRRPIRTSRPLPRGHLCPQNPNRRTFRCNSTRWYEIPGRRCTRRRRASTPRPSLFLRSATAAAALPQV